MRQTIVIRRAVSLIILLIDAFYLEFFFFYHALFTSSKAIGREQYYTMQHSCISDTGICAKPIKIYIRK